MQANGMARHFGWEDSARQYLQVYEQAIADARGVAAPAPVTQVASR
jgi:glycogen synthase